MCINIHTTFAWNEVFFSYQGLNYPFVRRPLKLKPRENPQSLKLHPSMQYAPN